MKLRACDDRLCKGCLGDNEKTLRSTKTSDDGNSKGSTRQNKASSERNRSQRLGNTLPDAIQMTVILIIVAVNHTVCTGCLNNVCFVLPASKRYTLVVHLSRRKPTISLQCRQLLITYYEESLSNLIRFVCHERI